MRRASRFIKSISAGFAVFILLGSQVVAVAEPKFDEDFYSSNDIVIYNPNDDTCASSSGGDTSNLVGTDNRQKIWNFLTAKGLSAEQAAGVMGNIQSESAGSWSPTVNEYSQPFGSGGYGIVQWTGGRRTQLVNSLNTSIPTVMSTYYNQDYSKQASATQQSTGFIPKSATTGQAMATDANDSMLLAELNYLYTESSNRTVSSGAIAQGLGSKGQTEWDAIKQQTTVEGASNLWVYSFEIPANIAVTAAARVTNGQAILALYSNSASGSACTSDGGSKQQLAQQIIATGHLTYDPGMSAQEKQLIPNIASGANNGNDWPCGMNIVFLKGILAITKEHTLRVNSLNRACTRVVPPGSSPASRHYAGDGSAVDFGPIDGIPSYSAKGANLILSYIGPLLVPNSTVGQVVGSVGSQSSGVCLPKSVTVLSTSIDVRRIGDFCTHLHIDVPPDADPSLQCIVPINYGGCDPSQQVKG